MRSALVALVPLLLAACVATAPSTPARGVVVSGPPPEPLADERPAPPNPQATWVAGYWHWTGMQYAWIPGHWESTRPGQAWAAPRYTVREGSYIYEPGGWHAATAPGPNANVKTLK